MNQYEDKDMAYLNIILLLLVLVLAFVDPRIPILCIVIYFIYKMSSNYKEPMTSDEEEPIDTIELRNLETTVKRHFGIDIKLSKKRNH